MISKLLFRDTPRGDAFRLDLATGCPTRYRPLTILSGLSPRWILQMFSVMT